MRKNLQFFLVSFVSSDALCGSCPSVSARYVRYERNERQQQQQRNESKQNEGNPFFARARFLYATAIFYIINFFAP